MSTTSEPEDLWRLTIETRARKKFLDPLALLEKQASSLAQHTDGAVEGKIEVLQLPEPSLHPPEKPISPLERMSRAADVMGLAGLPSEAKPRSILCQSQAVLRELKQVVSASSNYITCVKFLLHVPRLNKYQYLLFSVEYDALRLPIIVSSRTLGYYSTCESEKSFKDALTAVLSDRKTSRVIQALILEVEARNEHTESPLASGADEMEMLNESDSSPAE